jgi:hypothetical protein
MGMKTGLAVGFGLGYWFGAKAGEARYRQLEDAMAKLRSSSAYQSARDRARERLGTVVDDGMARARIALSDATNRATAVTVEADLPFYDQDRDRQR